MTDLQYVSQDVFHGVVAADVAATERVRAFAALARINTLYMIMRAGSGHIGSSFSSLDIVSWLYLDTLRSFRPDGACEDVYFSSKGHDAPGLYAVLTGIGRLDFDLIHRLRRMDGLPGHPDIAIPGIAANTGSLGMGISKAKGMVLADRIVGRRRHIYVMTGDGELQEGQIWESLASAANLGMCEITVIVDHNKVQSDTLVSRVSDLGAIEAKCAAFGWHVARCDGHDVAAFGGVIAANRAVDDRPKVIIADTVKGRGVSFMEHTAMAPDQALYAYHSGAPDTDVYRCAMDELAAEADRLVRAVGGAGLALQRAPDESGNRCASAQPSELQPQRLIPAYGDALLRQARNHSEIVVLDADLVLDCGLIPFRDAYPERFVECGIAEQDMVSQASGLALSGLLPVVHSFACFLSARPNEQIYNNATEKTKIIYTGSLAGLLPAGPGHSHQCVRDIAALAAIPNLELIEPCHTDEVAAVVDYCINQAQGSCYIRLVSIPVAVPFSLPSGYMMQPGRGVAIIDGADAVVIAYGPVMLTEAWHAAAILRASHGIRVRVVNLPWLNRIDPKWLREETVGMRWVFTVDNHYVSGGQGSMIADCLAEHFPRGGLRLRKFGVREIPRCGRNDVVLRSHRLDAASLAAEIARSFGNDTGTNPSQ